MGFTYHIQTELPFCFNSFVQPDIMFMLANFLLGAEVASDISFPPLSFSASTEAVIDVSMSS